MRINKVRFLNQQHAVRAAETKTVQAAVSGLADMVAAFREAVAAKVTGAPTVAAAVSDLTEKVADIQVEAAKVAMTSGVVPAASLVKVEPQAALVTPDVAREIAHELIVEADQAEKK